MDINLKAPFFLSKYFHEYLGNKKGNIINILDQRVVNLTPYFISYTLSKSALWTLTQSLALSLAPKIRVNAISPGGIFRNQPKKFIKRYLGKTPLGRMGTENDIANAVIFLSSNLSTYITGQNLIVDGGYSNA